MSQSKRVSKKVHYVMYRGPPIRPSAEFSAEISEAKKVWHNIFKVLTGEGKKKKKTSKEEYSIQQGYYPELKKRKAKAKGIYHH